jgi:protein tyrosine phosphatase domain-containing protein 1
MTIPPHTYKRAFPGLNSNQITQYVYGSERPSTRIIQENHLIPLFKKLGVQCIINLQEQNEHAKYNKLQPEGFSYKFSEFENNVIQVHHHPIPDFGVPTEAKSIHDIVQTMHNYVQKQQSVIVHCQAGVGRTALVICCYLLFSKICNTPEDAIIYVSQRRRIRMQSEQEDFITTYYTQYCS